MKARYRIHHTSTYQYDKKATASFNEARLTPLTAPWQNPLDVELRVDGASWHYRYVDYWGTQVRVFEADRPHSELVVRASSLVEVEPAMRAPANLDMSWAQVRAPAVAANLGEFIAQLPSTAPAPDLALTAEALAAQSATPAEAALAISGAVHNAMSYVPGSTGVQTSASEAWAERSGVCQDYAHLVIGALRHVGLAARYVSGYLHPNADAQLGEPVLGESHAWVEWWLGEWVSHDPTNMSMVSDRHVVVGAGRDYRDVPPIKGIVAGTPIRTDLQVKVEITRMA
ncbi:MAG: transglutaminase family protein [Actinomycetota bacterium]|nr:transglutaminase family protein [Actinomycetota bacterium]